MKLRFECKERDCTYKASFDPSPTMLLHFAELGCPIHQGKAMVMKIDAHPELIAAMLERAKKHEKNIVGEYVLRVIKHPRDLESDIPCYFHVDNPDMNCEMQQVSTITHGSKIFGYCAHHAIEIIKREATYHFKELQ